MTITTIVLLAHQIFVINNEKKKGIYEKTDTIYNIGCNTRHACYIFLYIDEIIQQQHNKLEI